MMVLKRRLLLGARSGEWFFVNPPQQGRKLGVMAIRQLVRKEHLCDRASAYNNWMTDSQLTIQPSTKTRTVCRSPVRLAPYRKTMVVRGVDCGMARQTCLVREARCPAGPAVGARRLRTSIVDTFVDQFTVSMQYLGLRVGPSRCLGSRKSVISMPFNT